MLAWKQLIRSFRYAAEGMIYAILTQRNMQIHLGVAWLVMLLSLFLDVSNLEIILIFFAIVLVIAAELINTAIEAVVDLVTDRFHPLAKIAKDVAAAAVLLTALQAVIIGFLIFYDKLFPLRVRDWNHPEGYVMILFFVCLGMILLLFFVGISIKRGTSVKR